MAQQGFDGARGIVSQLGIELSEPLGHALDAAQSGMSAVTKFMSGDFVGAAMAAVSAVISLVKCFLSMGDGVGEAIDREREFIEISKEMEQQIRELEKTIGDIHAAISMLLGEITAEAEINQENFANYAQRTRDILADLDEGTLSVKETTEALGSAWNELLSEAQRLGTEGSREMIALIRDVRGRGLYVVFFACPLFFPYVLLMKMSKFCVEGPLKGSYHFIKQTFAAIFYSHQGSIM